jgi:hypothetical protein
MKKLALFCALSSAFAANFELPVSPISNLDKTSLSKNNPIADTSTDDAKKNDTKTIEENFNSEEYKKYFSVMLDQYIQKAVGLSREQKTQYLSYADKKDQIYSAIINKCTIDDNKFSQKCFIDTFLSDQSILDKNNAITREYIKNSNYLNIPKTLLDNKTISRKDISVFIPMFINTLTSTLEKSLNDENDKKILKLYNINNKSDLDKFRLFLFKIISDRKDAILSSTDGDKLNLRTLVFSDDGKYENFINLLERSLLLYAKANR